jgi:hypothetical protein
MHKVLGIVVIDSMDGMSAALGRGFLKYSSKKSQITLFY